MGSRHQDEGFGDDWELPPDRAYCETCAGVASVMVSWRLFLATGEVRYADLMERTFYNVVATSPRTDGRAFFYANPLQQRVAGADVLPDAVNPRAEGGVRAPWFDISCCPTNVARTLASWHTYAASVDGDTVTLLQYAAADLSLALDAGGEVGLKIRTQYPLDGTVRVEVTGAPDRPVTLRLRVPHWADGATVAVATVAVGARPGGAPGGARVAPGWADVRRVLVPGDVVTLVLPTTPRFTWPDPRVDAVRGCVAVERGPLVLCAESVDLPGERSVDQFRVDPAVPPRDEAEHVVVSAQLIDPPARPWPYGADDDAATSPPTDVALIPYHQWANRGPSTMRVWLPTV
jgi:DUF1680 family protein